MTLCFSKNFLMFLGLSAAVSGEHISTCSPALSGHAEGKRNRLECRWLKLHCACCCWSGVIHMCLFVFFRGSPPLMMRSWRFFCPSSRFWALCVSFEASAPTITSPLGSFWTPRSKQTTLCCSTPSFASSSRGICGCVVILVSTKVSDSDVCVYWTSKSK